MEEQKLSINNLCVSFQSDRGSVTAVEDVTFGIRKGEILGMIGESGCGKSTIGLSIMNLLPEKTSNIDKGEIGNSQFEVFLAEVIKGRKVDLILNAESNDIVYDGTLYFISEINGYEEISSQKH